MANQSVQDLQDAFNQIDASTTKAGAAATAIQTRLQALLDQIAVAPSPADMTALVAQAQAEVAKLSPISDALTAMGTDPTNPVPVPVPDPTPAPTT